MFFYFFTSYIINISYLSPFLLFQENVDVRYCLYCLQSKNINEFVLESILFYCLMR